MFASGQSLVGPSPSTSFKGSDRLKHRNAILRRTGFLEGTHIKGSLAGLPRIPVESLLLLTSSLLSTKACCLCHKAVGTATGEAPDPLGSAGSFGTFAATSIQKVGVSYGAG